LGGSAIITLDKMVRRYDLYKTCIGLLNKLIFTPSKAFYDINGTYYDYAVGLDAKLNKIRRRVISGKYVFSPYVHKTVKIGHKKRDIFLASWQDKIVERWIAYGLNETLHKWMSINSYAYRPGKFGLDICQRKIAKACKPGIFIIRRDISNFFYSIPHDKLITVIEKLVDDPLLDLLKQRIYFEHSDGTASVGIPFGSPIACVFANIYLTKLDREIEKLPVNYFRYADDFLIIADDFDVANEAALNAEKCLHELRLQSKKSHTQNLVFSNNDIGDFKSSLKLKFLGLEFKGDGTVRLGIEKQRKIINLFSKEFKLLSNKLKKLDLNSRVKLVVDTANDVLTSRIRSAAIIDYYLKHVNDEKQLKLMDLYIAQSVISSVLGKPFRYKHFSVIKYKKLREVGLVSLVHRHRLHKQGHLKIHFLSLFNDLVIKRHHESLLRRHSRIQQMSIARKLKKTTK